MRVRLIGEHDLVGKGWVPDGTIIENKDAHWLVAMGVAEEIKDASREAKAQSNDPDADDHG